MAGNPAHRLAALLFEQAVLQTDCERHRLLPSTIQFIMSAQKVQRVPHWDLGHSSLTVTNHYASLADQNRMRRHHQFSYEPPGRYF